MNYFAHALPFLDDPYFAVASGVPDMLAVVDRSLKVRTKHARPFVDDPDPVTAAVAGGICQHLRDDRHFHKSVVFAETTLGLTLKFRDAMGDTTGLRPRFLGHLMTELLLDAALIEDDRQMLEKYYEVMESVDTDAVQDAVNRIAPRPTERLSPMISAVCRERFLWDYLNNAKLTVRVNQIMRRVGLDPVPESFEQLLPEARRTVAQRKHELLEGIPTKRVSTGL
ncbi:MAG: hypothetical protein U9N87_11560 [Planctomycetota bacterium]|nr:hypothetical protein [Planctomycetota bacterium]